MRLITYILFILILCSCNKDDKTTVEKDVGECEICETPQQGQGTIDIKGKWYGILKCDQCCDKEYNFSVDIDSFDESTKAIEAKLVISVLNKESEKAVYNCVGSFKENNTLEIQTYEIIEQNSSSCYFCEQNQYEFTKQASNAFVGKWKYSSNCDQSTIQDSSITITKQ